MPGPFHFKGEKEMAEVFAFSPFGYEGSLVSVEVDIRRGIPAVDIVGLSDGAVKESRGLSRQSETAALSFQWKESW